MSDTSTSLDAFLKRPKADAQIRLNISRNTCIALLVSLIIHALIAWKVVPDVDLDVGSFLPKSDKIVVTLAPPPKEKEVEEVKPAPPPAPQQKTKVIAKQSKPKPKPKKAKPKTFSVPTEMVKPAPSKPVERPKETPKQNAPVDMAEYVKQQQAKRQSVESEAAAINAAAIEKARKPTEEEKRNQRIMENLKVGTNGIFDITRIDALGASFKFKGWTNDYSSARTQYFNIPAQKGKDTRLLIVKRMIKLIREHYDGDFTWQSHRLNRSVTLSAKPEDNAGLEDFLMQEFFGPNYRN